MEQVGEKAFVVILREFFYAKTQTGEAKTAHESSIGGKNCMILMFFMQREVTSKQLQL